MTVIAKLTPKRSGVAANRELFSALDYLQMACVGARSVAIHCFRGDDLMGTVWVRHGVVWSASDGNIEGRDAFVRIVSCDAAEITPLPDPLPNATIDEPWEPLVLDALRVQDELGWYGDSAHPEGGAERSGTHPASKRRLSSAPPMRRRTTRPPGAADVGSIDDWLMRAAQYIVAHDFRSAADAYRQVLVMRPHHVLARRNLERLAQLAGEDV